MDNPLPIHAARIKPARHPLYLFLKEAEPGCLQWFQTNRSFDKEEATTCKAATIPLAIAAASRFWHHEAFHLLHCGFRYTLPERDEVGCNAFFWQMAKSYSVPNGRYFDPEVGHLCYVDLASQEALSIWRTICDRNNRPL